MMMTRAIRGSCDDDHNHDKNNVDSGDDDDNVDDNDCNDGDYDDVSQLYISIFALERQTGADETPQTDWTGTLAE